MLAIYKREVRSYFQSMVGCVFVAFLIAFTGIYFMAYNLTAGYPYFSYTLSGTLIGSVASDSSGQSVEGCAWKISCNGNGNWNPECDLLCVPINH